MSLDLSQYSKVSVTEEKSNVLTEKPKVSVLVVSYNHSKYINACIDGILNQETTFEFEIILGDDESSDGTREILQEYVKSNTNMRLFLHNRKNNIEIDGRPSGRYNFLFGLKNCRGKYIALCEGDDYWTDTTKLQKQVDFLESKHEYNLCTARSLIKDQLSGKLFKEHDSLFTNGSNHEITLQNFLGPFVIYTNSVMFRNIDIFSVHTDVKAFKDIYLFARLLNSGKGVCLADVTGVYRKHPGGQWSMQSENATLRENLRTASAMLLEFNTPSFRFFFRQSFLKLHSSLIQQGGIIGAISLIVNHWKACRNAFAPVELLYLFSGNLNHE